MNEDLDKRMDDLIKRMDQKALKEREEQEQAAEKLRVEYLKRTGRTEVKP